VALAPLFGRVLATEISQALGARRRHNLEANGVAT
jgi:tRNA/tmRNA/rRNA uracil-C5-methylase (TrmA/RlmC/RlmD family)